MFYGYDESTPHWNEELRDELANKLSESLEYRIYNGNEPRPIWIHSEEYRKKPYIEVDGTFGGVKLRRITHLSDEEQNRVTDRADAIYMQVMAGKILICVVCGNGGENLIRDDEGSWLHEECPEDD